MPKGRVLKGQLRQLVLQLNDFFEQENQNDGPVITISQVQNHVAATLSLSTVTKITINAYGKNGLE